MHSNDSSNGRRFSMEDFQSPFIDGELAGAPPDESESRDWPLLAESPFLDAFEPPSTEPEAEGETGGGDLFDPAELRAAEEPPSDESTGFGYGEETGFGEEANFGDEIEPEASDPEPELRELEPEADDGERESDEWGPAFEVESADEEYAPTSSDGEWVIQTESDGGQVVLLESASDEEEEAVRQPVKPRLKARILWPALGFPAVIAPRERPSGTPLTQGDATRCICVLVLSNREFLGKDDAARYLRYVRWSDRGRRHLPPGQAGSFSESDLAVRNDAPWPRTKKERSLALSNPETKSLADPIVFGGNADGENRITVSLARHVREFYRKQGLAYLHEIRVSEEASARLADGRYHLFWNNETAGDDKPSDEMSLLLEGFARPRRAKLMASWKNRATFLMEEYEYEYGSLHAPYSAQSKGRTRAEILHPLFVQRRPADRLRIGHLTDLHVDVRADVYEENLRHPNAKEDPKLPKIPVSYNNWNKSVVKLYEEAKRDSDVLLLTGDLIDYGRGHWGIAAREQLGQNAYYQEDRNWFLFSYLIATGDRYTRPVYTILGNHDWRVNPYPPLATGAPSPEALIHNYPTFKPEEQKAILRKMHGAGHERGFSYAAKAENAFQLLRENTGQALKALLRMFGGTQTMDVRDTPAHTTIESVAWYLLSINPFLDYAFTLPSRHEVLMLDWAENENVLFPVTAYGENWKYNPFAPGESSGPGPTARDCLTKLQKWHVERFADGPGAAKIIGIHAPPIGPYSDWYDLDLFAGKKVYEKGSVPRGPTNYATKKPDGSVQKWNGHPLFAIRPGGGAQGMTANYNSFEKERPWFLKRVADPKSGVRLVLAGHIHRNGLFATRVAAKSEGPAVAGQMLVRATSPAAVRGARPPAVSMEAGLTGKQGPLYVNTTSAGPRGHSWPRKGLSFYIDPGYAHIEIGADGTIHQVEFRPAVQAAQKPAPRPAHREVAAGV